MSIKDKIEKNQRGQDVVYASVVPAVGHSATIDFSNPSLGAYSKQHSKTPEISAEAWEKAKENAAWKDSFAGRTAIRFFSGGVLGSIAFVGADLLVTKELKGYNPALPLLEQKGAVKIAAKAVDTVFAKPIQATVQWVTKDATKARNAVHFRQTNNSTKYIFKDGRPPVTVAGRTFAAEAFNVSAGFAAYSAADAIGRRMADIIDPNVKKSWLKDGAIDWERALKSAAKESWTIASLRAGEDIAVTGAYIYGLKAARGMLGSNFAADFDRNLLGGGLIANDKGKVTGNNAMTGMLYLQGAFTFYNWLTLHYREAYSYATNKIAGKPATLVGAPDAQTEAEQSKKSLLGKAGDLVKWSARDAIKAVLYMTPTIPFFSLVRSNQRRDKDAIFTFDKDGAVLSYGMTHPNSMESRRKLLTVEKLNDLKSRPDTALFKESAELLHNAAPDPHMMVSDLLNNNPHFDPHKTGKPVSDTIARVNHRFVSSLDGAAVWADNHLPGREAIKKTFNIYDEAGKPASFAGSTSRALGALVSYLPYKIAKREFGTWLDTGRMDKVIEDGLSSLAKGDLKGIKRSVIEIGLTMAGKPLTTALREEEAKKRDMLDLSPADVSSRTFSQKAEEKRHAALSWQERTISKKNYVPVVEIAAGHASVNPNIKDIIALHNAKDKNHAEKYAQALKELEPPTHSIN